MPAQLSAPRPVVELAETFIVDVTPTLEGFYDFSLFLAGQVWDGTVFLEFSILVVAVMCVLQQMAPTHYTERVEVRQAQTSDFITLSCDAYSYTDLVLTCTVGQPFAVLLSLS